MYFPTTRVLTVLELLQSHQRLSGPDIAERLEVNPRTVRRYITMLQDLGIPDKRGRGDPLHSSATGSTGATALPGVGGRGDRTQRRSLRPRLPGRLLVRGGLLSPARRFTGVPAG